MKNQRQSRQTRILPWGRIALVFAVVAVLVLVYLDARVRYNFNQHQWQLPARVFARPLEFRQGAPLQAEDLVYELGLLGYRASVQWRTPGQYRRVGDEFWISTRGSQVAGVDAPPQRFYINLARGRINRLSDPSGAAINSLRLEPLQIGSIYPSHREDRLLAKLDDVPMSLREILLLIEDRDFYSHWGLSPKAIARAALANIKAGRTVQGGSTITQQLVKNLYLTQNRSFVRKGLEAVMTVLVELHYSKDQILESYLNEVYLGQEGPRAIHGFALASQHYFNRPLAELGADQIALLVGMVKGPSYYDPWRNPERAKERRNVVLTVMAEHQLISASQLQHLQRRGLGLAKSSSMALVYPAYLDLVRRQLKRDYSQRDLQTQGLRIYTTFDPIVQRSAERSLAAVAESLDKDVEGAMVVTAVDRGDVLAVVGGRRMRFAGFNRALDAVRQIGSLAKPVVYLAALEQHQRYTLASTISDGPVVVEGRDGSRWQPRNFDRQSHGDVLLHRALAQSYNQATARLGMQLGLPAVTSMFERLGVQRQQPQVPALLLGAGAMTPIDVAQMYQTIAAGGVYRPLRTIVGIADKSGNTLARYPIQSHRVVDFPVVHLLHYSMMEVVREGTGKSVYQVLAQDFDVAGKTGSSNDLRDSWFAGFAGDYLAVTWLGRDDNGSSGLTGAAGALKVWRQFMADSSRVPLNLSAPPGVVYEWVDNRNGLKASRLCEDSRYIPFIQGSTPQQSARCQPSVPGVMKWFQGLF